MNLNLAICDDEMSDMKILTTHIEHYNIESNDNIIVSTFSSGTKLLQAHKTTPFDIVLLDIEMPETDGMQIAKLLRDIDDHLYIIFTTSYPEYMQDSFEVQPFQFLTKPISYDTIHRLFMNIIKKMNRNSLTIIVVDDDNEEYFISLNDIYYVSTAKEKKAHIKYHLADHTSLKNHQITYSDIHKIPVQLQKIHPHPHQAYQIADFPPH